MSVVETNGKVERIRPVRLIIAGTRGDYDRPFFGRTVISFLKGLMDEHSYNREDIEIFSGMAASGADYYAVLFAEHHKIALREFWAKWDVLDTPGAKVKVGKNGKAYNTQAGFDRNLAMAKEATHLLAFWDGKSPGTRHMIETARQFGVVTAIVTIATPRTGIKGTS